MYIQNTSRLRFTSLFYILVLTGILTSCQSPQNDSGVSVWVTSGDKSALFEQQSEPLQFRNVDAQPADESVPVIHVDPDQRFQEMDGFGYTLTGGSAMWINKMSSDARAELLRELFTTEGDGIGISYLRVSIGASDLDPHVFSYSDLPPGETDPGMERFSLDPDRDHLIPVLQEILELVPELPVLGSPWSPPVWMKDNNASIGGSLLPEFYDAYALYFVRYIQEMEKEGIPIDAITVQNEPLHPGNNPSLLMKADEQALFIKDHLGPVFESYGIDTKIIIYDHNLDRIDYPLQILDDPEAARYVDGTAFHLYGGEISSMSKVHEAHPDKRLYFTEQWVGANSEFHVNFPWHMQNLMIGAPRNWSRNVLQWNLAANSDLKPHTDGGCTLCLGALTIDGDKVVRNDAYYFIAHASKFVRPGSVRIGSNEPDGLSNVAFERPDGGLVLLVFNPADNPVSFVIATDGGQAMTELPPNSAGTYVW